MKEKITAICNYLLPPQIFNFLIDARLYQKSMKIDIKEMGKCSKNRRKSEIRTNQNVSDALCAAG